MIKTLLLLFSTLKFGKVLLSGGTMLLSLFTYALIYGWRYAAGFIALLFAHEMGHYLAARQRGLNVGLPTFIPFVGAWIQLKELPHDVETEAYVGLAGPVVGSIAAIGCYLFAREIHSPLLLAIAYSGLFINLINLVPVSPLDGGRITAVISPRIWLFGAPLLLGLFLWSGSPVMLLVAIMALPQLRHAWRGTLPAGARADYYLASEEQRWTYALCYLGLAALLGVLVHDVHGMLQGARAHA